MHWNLASDRSSTLCRSWLPPSILLSEFSWPNRRLTMYSLTAICCSFWGSSAPRGIPSLTLCTLPISTFPKYRWVDSLYILPQYNLHYVHVITSLILLIWFSWWKCRLTVYSHTAICCSFLGRLSAQRDSFVGAVYSTNFDFSKVQAGRFLRYAFFWSCTCICVHPLFLFCKCLLTKLSFDGLQSRREILRFVMRFGAQIDCLVDGFYITKFDFPYFNCVDSLDSALPKVDFEKFDILHFVPASIGWLAKRCFLPEITGSSSLGTSLGQCTIPLGGLFWVQSAFYVC